MTTVGQSVPTDMRHSTNSDDDGEKESPREVLSDVFRVDWCMVMMNCPVFFCYGCLWQPHNLHYVTLEYDGRERGNKQHEKIQR